MLMADGKEEIKERRDQDSDVARAIEKAQDIMRRNVGNLLAHQFRLESVEQNGEETKYIVICSIVPDLGRDRDYYFIKIDVESGNIVLPVRRGKFNSGKIDWQEMNIPAEWLK